MVYLFTPATIDLFALWYQVTAFTALPSPTFSSLPFSSHYRSGIEREPAASAAASSLSALSSVSPRRATRPNICVPASWEWVTGATQHMWGMYWKPIGLDRHFWRGGAKRFNLINDFFFSFAHTLKEVACVSGVFGWLMWFIVSDVNKGSLDWWAKSCAVEKVTGTLEVYATLCVCCFLLFFNWCVLVCNAKVMGTIHFNVVICCHLRELMQIWKELVPLGPRLNCI